MKTVICFAFIFILSVFGNSQVGWYYQNPIPTSSELTSIQFVDTDTGWTYGSGGTILHSTDGGESWEFQQIDSLYSIDELFFIDSKNGWGIGSILTGRVNGWPITKDVIIRTKNGGKNWSLQALINDYAYGTYSIFFSDKNTGWISSGNGLILKTIDGGDHWNTLDSLNCFIHDLYFINNKTGWAVGGGSSAFEVTILRTDDGGESWIPQKGNVNGVVESVYFINENTGYAVGTDNIILKTENGGNNWALQPVNETNHQLTSVFFTDVDHGFIAGWDMWLSTIDGGAHWSITEYPSPNALAIFFISRDIGWRVGGGEIQKTMDEGVTWNNQSKRSILDDLIRVDFTDKLNGWIISVESVYHTSDGGNSWELQYTIPTQGIHDMFAIDNLNCWIVGHNWETSSAFTLNTLDGGLNWALKPADCYSLNSTYFTDSNYGWAVGDSGTILYTEDGGENWEIQESGTTKRLHCVDFVNNLHGWVVGSDGLILYTSNGGIEWSTCNQDSLNTFRSIDFIDELNGWGVGGSCNSSLGTYYWPNCNGFIYHSLDGGNSWQLQQDDSTPFYLVKFLDDNFGWIISSQSLLFTKDGGNTWENQIIPAEGVNSVDFLDQNNGWLVGMGGLIMHTTDGGTTFIDEPVIQKTKILSNYILHQNYPNPFNPITTINYELPITNYIELCIYNILGQKVATLVSEIQPAGKYKVNWDAAGFASGIYIYQLQTDKDFVQTRKLVLLK